MSEYTPLSQVFPSSSGAPAPACIETQLGLVGITCGVIIPAMTSADSGVSTTVDMFQNVYPRGDFNGVGVISVDILGLFEPPHPTLTLTPTNAAMEINGSLFNIMDHKEPLWFWWTVFSHTACLGSA